MAAKSKKQFATLMVAPPNAQLIADGLKDVENRSKNCKFRGYVALYSTCSKVKDRFDYWKEEGYEYDPKTVDYGKIIGFVNIVDVIEPNDRKKYKGEWLADDCYGIWVKNIIKIKKPVPVRFPYGTINWGKLKGKPLEACLRQLSASQRKRLLTSLQS